MKRVMVTGANGFVGQALCAALEAAGYRVRKTVRHDQQKQMNGECVEVGEVGATTDWRTALAGMDAVVHLAARVHVMKDEAKDPLEAFRAVNMRGTENLARAAAESGVRRFVYLSSIKVNGEYTRHKPLSEDDLPHPETPYALSKLEAEQALHHIAAETGMEIVILRPPLVYGPGVKANFLRLLKWVDRGLPLPLASVENRRSLIYLANLVDAISTCLSHPAATGKTYMVSDAEETSTTELINRLAKTLGRPARLFSFPALMLHLLASFVGKQDEVERLLDSLEIDSSKIRRELNWSPPYSMNHGLQETADWYRSQAHNS